MSYTFKDGGTQERWARFSTQIPEKLQTLEDKLPKRPNPAKVEIEELIRLIMEKSFRMADILAQAEYFHEVAYSETIMDLWGQNPKQSTTLLKADADGRVADVTMLLARCKHVWKAMENCQMGAQSLLKMMP